MTDTIEPIDRAAVLALIRRWTEDSLDAAVQQALDDGASYAELGRLLDVSRQAVRQRYGRS